MNECLFCKIIAGEIPSQKIYEDGDTFVFLDIGPVSRGHALIIPKEHASDLNSGTEEAALATMRTLHRIASRLLKSLGATGYNLGMNHGLDGGQDVFHTHLHFMPRYAGDDRKFIKNEVSPDELSETARIMREGLES
ncbi:MAG: HIT family protein [Candidatus Uhrbacteria bacterium]|nr:HIT family protein [Candidatus Uhrbacteria bacterium]